MTGFASQIAEARNAATDPETARIEEEILAGLPNERRRMDDARKAMDYYHLRNEKYLPRRDQEEELDYLQRPRRIIPFTRRVVDSLCDHLYSPGPSRQISKDAKSSKWLEAAYSRNMVNSLCQRAEKLALLGGLAAFQVAATGDPTNPLTYSLWGADEIAVWPDHGPEPTHVCTVEARDGQRIYTLWTAEEIRTYATDPRAKIETSGGVCPVFQEAKPNPYGCIPFAFFHAEVPSHSFYDGCIGDYLVHVNGALDDDLSDLSHGVKRYLYPIGVAENCDTQFQPVTKFGAFVKLNTTLSFEGAPSPRLSYLQANLNIDAGWKHVENMIFQSLDAIGVPRAAWRQEGSAVASGIAIIAEQFPLLNRAKKRREPARRYETDLARVSLTVGAAYYETDGPAEPGPDLDLILAWPPLTLPIPGPDQDEADRNEMDMGISSRVMIIMRREGLSREQAIERVKQIAKDKAEVEEIDPTPDPFAGVNGGGEDPNQPPPGDQGDNQGDGADTTTTDEGAADGA